MVAFWGIGKNKEAKFWNWFVKNERGLFSYEDDRERIFNGLASALARVHPDLTFEIGPLQKGRRQFVISAGGIRLAFAAVQTLADAAPPLERWTVCKFRPRQWPLCNVQFGGISVEAKDVQFALLSSPSEVGIYLYIPGYDNSDSRYGQIGYLMLDQALGEYDVETKVGLIRMFAQHTSSETPRYSLLDLPSMFDALCKKSGI
ncbi:MAG: hypothetical protein ACYC26_02285 [Phycisphaerales bacterium]